jgi:transcriptional regulator with XRE-family HTH domain
MNGSPTVRRRRLAAELRRLRELDGRTGDEIAAALDWSPSKVSRYELARGGLRPSDVGKLLDEYGVAGRHREQLLELANEATQKGWWEDFADALVPEYLEFIGLEAEASSVSHWQTEVIPGLLQSEEYARQIQLGYQTVVPIPPRVVERRVQARMIRQRVLTRDPPLDLSVVIDESVLQRRFGSRRVMYEQMIQLATIADMPSVELRVLPLDSDHSVAVGSFVVFRFGSAHETSLHDVVSTEQLRSEIYVQGEDETYELRRAFARLAEESLMPAESKDLILRTARNVWA